MCSEEESVKQKRPETSTTLPHYRNTDPGLSWTSAEGLECLSLLTVHWGHPPVETELVRNDPSLRSSNTPSGVFSDLETPSLDSE